jgi:hypothetical protein
MLGRILHQFDGGFQTPQRISHRGWFRLGLEIVNLNIHYHSQRCQPVNTRPEQVNVMRGSYSPTGIIHVLPSQLLSEYCQTYHGVTPGRVL